MRPVAPSRFMIVAGLILVLGFVISAVMTPVVIHFSSNGLGMDFADGTRKVHQRPTSRLGGIPLVTALAVILTLIQVLPKGAAVNWLPIGVGSLLMFGLGLWDDFRSLGARKKFLGQIAIASLVYLLGLSVEYISYPRADAETMWRVHLGDWSFAVTVFWLIAVPNIVNLIDGFDGLASGLGVFMAMTLGIVCIFAEQLSLAWYAFGLSGALLGFLCFNFPPAKIFLGDGGAYLIGYSIASVSVTGSHKGSIAAMLMVTVIVLGIPILDTTMALARRALRGFPIFHGDDEHIHHKLKALGLSNRRIVLTLYAVCVVLSLIGLSIVWSQGRTIPIAIGSLFLMAVFALQYLNPVRNVSDARLRIGRSLKRRRAVKYALLQAEVMNMEVERCVGPEEFWPVFHQALHRVGFVDKSEEEVRPDYIRIQIQYNGSLPWVLYAPPEDGTMQEWKRIAECFKPAYLKARQRWHT